MTARIVTGLGLALGLLTACGAGPDIILPGERIPVAGAVRGNPLAGGPVALVSGSAPIALPVARAYADWPQRNGGPSHRLSHPALPAQLSLAFATNIGAGDSRRARITADPVVADGRVFTLDAASQVAAVSTGGQVLWTANVTPGIENGSASGGGLAVSGGRLFVTTGYGELTALDAATGREIWTQDLDAPGGGAPTVQGDLVYLVARDGTAWAVDAGSGRIRWTLPGTPSDANVAAGPGAAVTGDIALFPRPTGEIVGAFPEGGMQRWSTVVAGGREGRAAAQVQDITGDPVIDGDRAYIGNFAGRVAALRVDNGEMLWSAAEGATSPVWPEGGSLFIVSDLNQLVRLNAADGAVIWQVQLPGFVESNARRQKTLYTHHGPVLAGGRLLVASSDGTLKQFDPRNGALIGQVALPGGATTGPVVAGGTLYVVSGDGQLLAFR